MKIKLAFWVANMVCLANINAQNTVTVLKSSNGDEQGLEVPKSLVIPQDKKAYTEALQGWYVKDKNENPHSADWFANAHFGCFVHWGVSATLAGEWNGVGRMGYAEHIMRSRTIPLAESTNVYVELQYNTASNTDSGTVVLLVDNVKYPINYTPTFNANTSANLRIDKVALSEGKHTIQLQLEKYNGVQAMQPMQLQMIPIRN